MRWSLEGVGNLRLRLVSHTNMLILFIVTLERYERNFFDVSCDTLNRLVSHAD